MKVDKALLLETPELGRTRREWEGLCKLWNKLRKDIGGSVRKQISTFQHDIITLLWNANRKSLLLRANGNEWMQLCQGTQLRHLVWFYRTEIDLSSDLWGIYARRVWISCWRMNICRWPRFSKHLAMVISTWQMRTDGYKAINLNIPSSCDNGFCGEKMSLDR